MLRQIEWEVQNRPITKNEVLTSDYSIFSKILFQFKNLVERVDLMCKPNVHIHNFSRALEFYLRVFFPSEYP